MAIVVIDTDGVRDLARYTRGAIDQVARIRLELVRAGEVLGTGAGAQRYASLLADLAGYAAMGVTFLILAALVPVINLRLNLKAPDAPPPPDLNNGSQA